MLHQKFTEGTPLPLPGSFGFLRGTAQKARVLRANGDGRHLVQLFHRPRGFGEWEPVPGSSGNTLIEAADIYPTEEAATHLGRKPQRRRARGRRA